MNASEILASVHTCGLDNTTNNTSCSEDVTKAPFSKTLQITMTSFYVIVFITSILGNGLGLRIVLRTSSVNSFSCLLIGNKAFADLLTTIFTTPYMVFYLHNQNVWFGGVAGTITCKLSQFPFAVSLAASVFTVVIISIDRFIAVVYPLQRRRFLPNPKTTTLIIWILSVAVMLAPYLIPYRAIQMPNGQYHCGPQWGEYERTIKIQKLFYMALFILMYVIPLVLTVIALSSVVRRLWRRKIPGHSSKVYRRAAQKANRQIAKLLIFIMVVFAICWAPVHMMHFLAFEAEWKQISAWVVMLSFWLCHANSAIDPFLYIICNYSFRREIENTVSKCCTMNCDLKRKSSSYTFNGFTSRVVPSKNNKCCSLKGQREMALMHDNNLFLQLPQTLLQ